MDTAGVGASTTVWDWLNQLNAAEFAGHDDWRLPSQMACNSCWSGSPTYTCGACSARESETILSAPYLCGTAPCINPIFGPTNADGYWSASTDSTCPGHAWGVYFGDGGVFSDGKASGGFYVRAVRASP